MRKLDRNIAIAGGVIALHVAALWALQAGLLRRTVEVVVPVRILTEMVAPPEPKIEPPHLPPTAQQPEPVKRPPARKVERASPAAPRPQKTAPVAAPAPEAPLAVVTPQPAPAAPLAAAPAPPGPETGSGPSTAGTGTGTVELPSSDASYLQNPLPAYPTLSKRLGEQGKVVVRVLIGKDGMPQRAELKRSSGFDRLDRAAVEYVMKCRYVPGKIGGVPQAMWYEAPVNFVLE